MISVLSQAEWWFHSPVCCVGVQWSHSVPSGQPTGGERLLSPVVGREPSLEHFLDTVWGVGREHEAV